MKGHLLQEMIGEPAQRIVCYAAASAAEAQPFIDGLAAEGIVSISLHPRYIYSSNQIVLGVHRSLLSFKHQKNKCRGLEKEVYFRLSGKKNIHQALEDFSPVDARIVVVLLKHDQLVPASHPPLFTRCEDRRVPEIAEYYHLAKEDIPVEVQLLERISMALI